MCGLAGFTGFKNNIELAELANTIQRHRGPDNQSVWNDEYIALAHQRLSIIDLSDAANQPFQKSNLMIIFNGEIYNYKELMETLKKEKNVDFSTSSDTEVVLEYFRHYGEACLDYFIGMFVFAIYNKENSELFIARDHFGIKPLFYTTINSGFAFSSELKTLAEIPDFNKTLNKKALVSSLNYRWVSGDDSMFEGCYKLPPAHYLWLKPGEDPETTKYWELADSIAEEYIDNERKAVEDINSLMEASVKRHMVADVPVSAFLSGGLDSSLISILARKGSESLSTYTIGTTDEDKKGESMPDDEKYADILAKEFNLDHNVITINPNILNEFPEMVRMLDEPVGDPAAINTYLICKAARDKGVKVLLSGMGADEMFFGYRRQKATLMAAKYNHLPKFLKAIIKTCVNWMPVKIGNKGIKITRWAKRFIGFSSLPIDEAYMRSYSYYDSPELQALLTENFWPAINLINEEHKAKFKDKFEGDPINQMCNTDLSMFMLGLNITYTDRASMAASVEARVPFIDKEVITGAMKVPGYLKYKKKESKYILKKAAENHLPEKIIYRPKASFSAPIRSWISNDLKNMVDDLLSEEKINQRGILNYDFVRNMIEKDRKGQEDYAYQIYQLLTLELWCQHYLDN